MRVLIVEDQSRTRQSLRLLLQTVPAITEVYEAADGREAVEKIPELSPHLVVMDGRMPVMDGAEAAGRIKSGWPHVKIILLSMYPEYRESVGASGADAFVSKGEPPELLLQTINALLFA